MSAGHTKRAGSMDDIMTMESDLIRLQGENARLRSVVESMLLANTEFVKKDKHIKSLRPYIEAYVSARDASSKAVQDNNLVAKNHESTGTGHQTPFHVLDSVRKWQKSAVSLAEEVSAKLKEK